MQFYWWAARAMADYLGTDFAESLTPPVQIHPRHTHLCCDLRQSHPTRPVTPSARRRIPGSYHPPSFCPPRTLDTYPDTQYVSPTAWIRPQAASLLPSIDSPVGMSCCYVHLPVCGRSGSPNVSRFNGLASPGRESLSADTDFRVLYLSVCLWPASTDYFSFPPVNFYCTFPCPMLLP